MTKQTKSKKSIPALIIDFAIALAFLMALACFVLYYTNTWDIYAVLIVGIVAFTIAYQLFLRIAFGKLTKKCKITHKHWWFRQRFFESRLYKLLMVKKWKKKALTYEPKLFDLKKNSLEQIANNMAKVETDHWLNVLISLSTLLFAIPWGLFWIFFAAAVAAVIFDAQFIAIQRFNRPNVLRLIEKRNQKKAVA